MRVVQTRGSIINWAALVMLAGIAGNMTLAGQDPLEQANQQLRDYSGNTVNFTFEERTRWEERYGVNFGKSVNQQDMLSRLRIGIKYRPADWLTFSAMGQDARVPFYGAKAPNSIRDTIDLQEAYVELFADRKTGFGAMVGRKMLDYGDSRVIGTPQWSNVARTFDSTRLYYRTESTRFELLMVSPVKVLPDEFNKPELGERIWGTYNTFSKVWRNISIDAYGLRHSQNRIGGWAGPGSLGTNTFGSRMYGPLPAGFAYNGELIGQTGHAGLLSQRAYAWFAGTSKTTKIGDRMLLATAEYKIASGTKLGASHSSTYDQLSPANHDKFGHEDLFGWRNLKTFKSLETFTFTKVFALNVMYTNHWLYSSADALYNSQGSAIAVSKTGKAGSHVGQELDAFVTYKAGAHTLGAGMGHFFKGEFIENTTPRVNPRYFYVFQQYSLK